MEAEVLKDCLGAIDGDVYPTKLKPGDKVYGDLAKTLVQGGFAKALQGAPKNKMLEGARFPEEVDGDSGERPVTKKKRPSKAKKKSKPDSN